MKKFLQIAAVLIGLWLSFSTPVFAQTTALVQSITDGDTVVLSDGKRIRLACIDAPESSQLYGMAATEKLRSLIPVGSSISITTVDVDRFRRTVAIIFSGETNVNLEMVKTGNTAVYRKYLSNCPTIKSKLLAAEAEAKEQTLGLWQDKTPCLPWDYRRGNCTDEPQIGGCDPSYPDVCIPKFPPDLDCKDISERRFRVVGDDPHGFDLNKDGIGCEGK